MDDRLCHTDDVRVRYRERVIPGFSWWIVVASVVAMIAIAYGAALGAGVGVLVASVLGPIAIVALVRSSPAISVTENAVACGAAQLPSGAWRQPKTVAGPELTSIRRGHSPDAGDRVFQVVPAWFARAGVLLPLDDPSDPHSAWLIATRHPDRLTAALELCEPA